MSNKDANSRESKRGKRASSHIQSAGYRPPKTVLTKSSIPFWENQKAKLTGLVILYALEFIFTLPTSMIVLVFSPKDLALFPLGLAQALALKDFRSGGYYISDLENESFYIGLGWLFYLGISTAIMASDNKNIVRVLFIILTILLLLNAGGCQTMPLPSDVQ